MNPSLHAVHVLLLTALSGAIAKRTQLLFGAPISLTSFEHVDLFFVKCEKSKAKTRSYFKRFYPQIRQTSNI